MLQTASASQVTSKKDSKLEAKGTNRTQDIRIENFDIAYGDRLVKKFLCLLKFDFLQSPIKLISQSVDLTDLPSGKIVKITWSNYIKLLGY